MRKLRTSTQKNGLSKDGHTHSPVQGRSAGSLRQGRGQTRLNAVIPPTQHWKRKTYRERKRWGSRDGDGGAGSAPCTEFKADSASPLWAPPGASGKNCDCFSPTAWGRLRCHPCMSHHVTWCHRVSGCDPEMPLLALGTRMSSCAGSSKNCEVLGVNRAQLALVQAALSPTAKN